MTTGPVVVVTGAGGFVGGAVTEAALRRDLSVRAAVRSDLGTRLLPGVGQTVIGTLGADDSRVAEAVEGATAIVHTAARVHVMRDRASDPLGEFRRVNVHGTMQLARAAAKAGVRRFVFVSSIKVNGERTDREHPFTADDPPHPADPYGISKREAEDALCLLARETGMEVVIVRPVLVYGPGVKANFRTLLRCLHHRIPLPLGSIDNRRSLVGVDNLADLLLRCVEHPAAANQTFLASDGVDLSTPELLRRTATALGTSARLLSVPPTLLKAAGRVTNRSALIGRLCDSLQVDITKSRDRLGWAPPVSVDTMLQRTAQDFLRRANGGD